MVDKRYYEGYEPEKGFVVYWDEENQMEIWEGYLNLLFSACYHGLSSTQGLLECYRNWNGFYEEEGWKIPDLDVAIKELECFDEKMGEPVSPEFGRGYPAAAKGLTGIFRKSAPGEKVGFRLDSVRLLPRA